MSTATPWHKGDATRIDGPGGRQWRGNAGGGAAAERGPNTHRLCAAAPPHRVRGPVEQTCSGPLRTATLRKFCDTSGRAAGSAGWWPIFARISRPDPLCMCKRRLQRRAMRAVSCKRRACRPTPECFDSPLQKAVQKRTSAAGDSGQSPEHVQVVAVRLLKRVRDRLHLETPRHAELLPATRGVGYVAELAVRAI